MDAKRYEQQFWNREYTEGCGFRERFYEEINELAWEDIFRTVWPLTGRTVAFIGCGTACGPVATMRRHGARVIAMDISAEAVRQVRDYRRYDGRGSVIPLVGDAERLPLANDSVDVVLGKAIVHHLDVRRFAREAARVLRPGGRLIFWEPLGTNPIINLVRDLTPGLRVPTEHPLIPAHLKQLSACFDDFRCEYHLCTSLIALPLFWLGLRRVPIRVLRRLDRIDQRWCRLSEPLRNLAWVVAVSGRKPAAGQAPQRGFSTVSPAAHHPENDFGR